MGAEGDDLLAMAAAALGAEPADTIRRALVIARAHASGDAPSVKVARLLIAQRAEAAAIAAVLLAPLVQRGAIDRREIELALGGDVASLVEEVARVHPLRWDSAADLKADCAELLRTSALDPRTIIARVGLRLVELEAASTANDSTRPLLALEARELLVPLADRLGLGALRSRLEDACFRVLEPEAYRSIAESIEHVREADDVCLDLVAKRVALLLERHGVSAEVFSRAKSIWGIYRKMKKLGVPLDGIMDRLGLRIIVQSVPDCYRLLGLLHSHFRPIPGTFDDYIGLPKENGYQSLHTCVYPVPDVSAKPIEFQIRTHAMHTEAEFGLAAHWLYRSQTDAEDENRRQRQWLRELENHHDAARDHEGFVSELRRLVYEQSLVVFLRGGRQVRLPAGSTARDLVQRVGKRPETISSLVVNSESKPLDTPLDDGDTVEWPETIPPAPQASLGMSLPLAKAPAARKDDAGAGRSE
jgi:GTP pyrophosphokinase